MYIWHRGHNLAHDLGCWTDRSNGPARIPHSAILDSGKQIRTDENQAEQTCNSHGDVNYTGCNTDIECPWYTQRI
jgi:hypothetical protein